MAVPDTTWDNGSDYVRMLLLRAPLSILQPLLSEAQLRLLMERRFDDGLVLWRCCTECVVQVKHATAQRTQTPVVNAGPSCSGPVDLEEEHPWQELQCPHLCPESRRRVERSPASWNQSHPTWTKVADAVCSRVAATLRRQKSRPRLAVSQSVVQWLASGSSLASSKQNQYLHEACFLARSRGSR